MLQTASGGVVLVVSMPGFPTRFGPRVAPDARDRKTRQELVVPAAADDARSQSATNASPVHQRESPSDGMSTSRCKEALTLDLIAAQNSGGLSLLPSAAVIGLRVFNSDCEPSSRYCTSRKKSWFPESVGV